MDIKIDFRDKKAISMQIFEEIRNQIFSKQLQPGNQLPTVRELADQYDINFNTVARAYRLLDQEGLIITRQGRGTFVYEPMQSNEINQSQRISNSIEQLQTLLLREAMQLGIQPEQILQQLLERFPKATTFKKLPLMKRVHSQKKARRRNLVHQHLQSKTTVQAFRHKANTNNRKKTIKGLTHRLSE